MNTAIKSPALSVRGSQIVNADGQPVTLRGFGLGGWMNMENFVTGYPGNEQAQREAIRKVLGDELYELFFDRFLEYFFTEDDVRFISSLGLNLVRLPINYRHFEDDMNPTVIREASMDGDYSRLRDLLPDSNYFLKPNPSREPPAQ